MSSSHPAKKPKTDAGSGPSGPSNATKSRKRETDAGSDEPSKRAALSSKRAALSSKRAALSAPEAGEAGGSGSVLSSSEPIHSSTEHLRFLEHMLLEEFSAPDRGNPVESAIRGFKKFWVFTDSVTFVPTLPEREQSTPIQGKPLDKLLSAELAKDSDEKLTASILSEWGKDTPYPHRLVVVVGPKGATPHAVAFLIAREGPTDEPTCYYANTGLGAS